MSAAIMSDNVVMSDCRSVLVVPVDETAASDLGSCDGIAVTVIWYGVWAEA